MFFKNILIFLAFCTNGIFTRLTTPSFDHQEACQIPIGSKNDWKVFWPLAFHLNGSLYATEQFDDHLDVWIPKNEEFYLSCGPNYLNGYENERLESMKVKCSDNGKFLTTDKQLKSAKDLKCDLRPIEEVIVPVDGCPIKSGAISGQYGYIHPIDKSVRIVGESCYNTIEGRTLFSHIQLGRAEESLVKEVFQEDFFKKPHPSSSYKIDFMRAMRLDEFNERLQSLLGIEDLNEVPGYQIANFIDYRYLLSNKQLLATKKLVWNYFVIHDEVVKNFDRLKNDIAELGKEHEIDVFVGSHGITKLSNKSGQKVPIYLNNEKKQFPVPELIWMIVKSGTKATALGVFNNPSISKIESPCETSKCDQVTWLKKNGNFDGIVCCDYSEFRNVVKEVPRMPDVTKFYN